MTLTHSSASQKTTRWHRLALAAILLLATGLHFYRLDTVGYGNLYYAAAVKSMLSSWHNFFFAAFDPGGFVSVDKPPLGLWTQALSALVFGFNGWALMFPQALAGVLSVALLYHLVRRAFGPTAGVIAALVLTLTPISIAANRNNTMDSQLVLTSLLAAWAVSKAVERGRLRWLMLCAVFVGLGFNIKMLQAVMVLPAFYLLYLMAAPLPIWRRLWHLTLASGALAVVALSWAVIVDSTPATARPFVGSSTDNTVMELIVGHNGAARLGQIGQLFGLSTGGPGNRDSNNPPPNSTGGSENRPNIKTPPPNGDNPYGPPQGPGTGTGGSQTRPNETGEAGVFRLFNQQLGGQASWLLPLSLLCALAVFGTRGLSPLSWQGVILWSAWLIPQAVFFSFAGLFHRYYLEMMAPAIAALVGAGLVALWNDYREGHWRGWLLPVALLLGAGTEAYILSLFPDWGWLAVPVVGLSLIAAIALITLRLRATHHLLFTSVAVTLGLFALLLAPAVWSAFPVLGQSDVGLPYSGPELLTGDGGVGRGPRLGQTSFPQNDKLVAYLLSERAGEKYLAATLNANTAAPLILATGEPVMALGGFSGSDAILTTEELAEKVAAGEVRFFLVPAALIIPGGSETRPDNQPPNQRGNAASQWVTQNCAVVEDSLWRTSNGPQLNAGPNGPVALFDCGGH